MASKATGNRAPSTGTSDRTGGPLDREIPTLRVDTAAGYAPPFEDVAALAASGGASVNTRR